MKKLPNKCKQHIKTTEIVYIYAIFKCRISINN